MKRLVAFKEEFKDAKDIIKAVDEGKEVCWKSDYYKVIRDSVGQYLICCELNNHCIGLTWADGITLNGKPEDFYIKE